MLPRNWLELGIFILVIFSGTTVKTITAKRAKEVSGFKGINRKGPGKGWKLR